MKVAFPDSDKDVDNRVKILPLTTLIDDDNDDDDDDDGDNLDKKPPARLMVKEQMDLLEEQRKKYREMVMEIEDSDSEASDAGMTEAQKAACCKYLNGLGEPELTQNTPAKKKPDMSHNSTPPHLHKKAQRAIQWLPQCVSRQPQVCLPVPPPSLWSSPLHLSQRWLPKFL